MKEPSQEHASSVRSSFRASFKEAEDHSRKILSWAAVSAKTTAICWIILVAIIFFIAGPMVDTNPRYQRLSPTASAAANIAACVQLSGILLRLIHQHFLEGSRWTTKFGSGGFNTAMVIMSISAATNLLMANFPTPEIYADIAGMRIYTIRWTQWAILGGTQVFMIESLAAPHWKKSAFMALRQNLSFTVCIILPNVSDKPLIWWFVMLIGFFAVQGIYSRYYYSRKSIRENLLTKAQKNSPMGRLIIASNKLRLLLAISWTLVFLNYSGRIKINGTCLIELLLSVLLPGSLTEPLFYLDVCFVADCAIDCLSYLLFTAVIMEQYDICLNHSKLVEEHFAEIGMELNVIWNHCSDVLIAIVEKERVTLHLSKDKPVFEISVRTSPSLLGLTGQAQLDDLRLGDEDQTGAEALETVLCRAWEAQKTHLDDGKFSGSFNFTSEFKLVVDGTSKECELVVNKVVRTAASTTMVAVARDVSNRSKAFMLDFEKEKNSIARETAHTVKNLNTMAHHTLLELMDNLKIIPKELKRLEELHNLPLENKIFADYRSSMMKSFGVRLRQTLAIMMTAAQQTYQLSRVGEILRGEAQHLTTRVSDCTSVWEKICTTNFHAGADALALLVDEFRIVAILSNGWSNALAHGDCTRMDETEIFLLANFADKTLEVKIVNASQHDERPFESVDETTLDDLVDSQQARDGFGASPAAKLTTQMGLKWMRKLCDGRLSLRSDGNGGKTTLTCVLDADFSEFLSSAMADFVKRGKAKKKAMKKAKKKALNAKTTSITAAVVSPERPIYSTERPMSALPLSQTSRSSSGLSDEQRLSMVCPLPPASATIPGFTSSPDQSVSPLTPFASAHFELTERVDIRVWDTALSSALLRKFGVTVVDDSRAFALQMQTGFNKAFSVTKCRTLCGSKSTRYADICSLLSEDTVQEPALILLDRNLGHGVDTDGQRVSMPTGDIVSTRLRQNGFDCCLMLLTGDSSEQLDQYKSIYQGYLIDVVLDKHHLPSYVHVFEQYTQWIVEKLPFGNLLLENMEIEEEIEEEIDVDNSLPHTNSEEEMRTEALATRCINKVRGLRASLFAALSELTLLQNLVEIYRGVTWLVETKGNKTVTSTESKIHRRLKTHEDAMGTLVLSLTKALPLLKACKVVFLCGLIEAVLIEPQAALRAVVAEEKEFGWGETEATTIRKPVLMRKLAREVTLMQSIFVMAIATLDECLKEQKQVRELKNRKRAQSKFFPSIVL